MDKVASEIQKGTELKKCETKDSSAPVIDPDTKLKTVDRSALMSGVANPPELKKCETKDASAPRVEGVTVNKVDRVVQQQVIRQGAVTRSIEGFKGAEPLHKTEVQHDASAPVIDPEVKIKKVDRQGFMAGIANPPELKKCETKDCSAPVIDPDTKLRESDRAKMCVDIESAALKKK